MLKRFAALAVAPPVLTSSTDITGFARAYAPRDFQFPRDHGPHFDYQIKSTSRTS